VRVWRGLACWQHTVKRQRALLLLLASARSASHTPPVYATLATPDTHTHTHTHTHTSCPATAPR
jgi:hypothetical protein